MKKYGGIIAQSRKKYNLSCTGNRSKVYLSVQNRGKVLYFFPGKVNYLKVTERNFTAMNRNALRWILAALMALSLLLTLSAPSVAETADTADTHYTLPMDYKEGGTPPKAEGWVFDDTNGRKNPTSYEDSTISVTFKRDEIRHTLISGNHKGKTVTDETWVIRVKIKDVSQLRTAVSSDTYKGRGSAKIENMASSKNAVVAMNGDFFKYEFDVGYVVRQGELIRDASNNRRHYFDMLLIDSAGDFHIIPDAGTEKIDAYVAEHLTPEEKTILHTFNFGPALVLNGEAQDVSTTGVAAQGLWEWPTPIARTAIVQTGPLEYAIVVVDGHGKQTSGFTMQEFADYIAEQCPDAIVAYNLDGGGSAQLYSRKNSDKKKGEVIFEGSGARPLYDILYFASAEPEQK